MAVTFSKNKIKMHKKCWEWKNEKCHNYCKMNYYWKLKLN